MVGAVGLQGLGCGRICFCLFSHLTLSWLVADCFQDPSWERSEETREWGNSYLTTDLPSLDLADGEYWSLEDLLGSFEVPIYEASL